jgi:type I restriction enzyme S subunit
MRVKLDEVCVKASSNLKQSDIIDGSGDYLVFGAAGLIGNVDYYHQEQPYVAVVKDGAGIGRTMLFPAKSSVIGTMQYLLPKSNVLPEYLCYVVRYMHLEKYFSGLRYHTYIFRDYKNEEFNLVDLEKQAEIVEVLGRTERIIKSRKQELQTLDDLIKARFVEMFETEGLKKEPLSNNVQEMFIGPFGSSLKNDCFVGESDAYCMVYEQKHAIKKTMNVPTRYVDEKKYNELKRFSVYPNDIIVSCRGNYWRNIRCS